jgi:hypothetical protein
MSFAERVLAFYKRLKIEDPLPDGVTVLNPYQNEKVLVLCKTFYSKYYNDDLTRFLILGINPGRYGAGITGVPFTDPIKMETLFGIQNPLPKKAELSADFIHAMIKSFGGPEFFFSKYYINSVSPLGFTMAGKNVNYYNSPQLQKALEPFIIDSIQSQVKLGINTDVAFCLGEGINFKYLQRLNKSEKFFLNIIPLPHPRFIMQYKRKLVERYIQAYVQKLKAVL